MSWHLLLSIPLPQPVTSNPQRKPYHSFSGPLKICLMDMFPYKKTELFARFIWWYSLRKNPGNAPLFGSYLSFLDSNTTVSTCIVPTWNTCLRNRGGLRNRHVHWRMIFHMSTGWWIRGKSYRMRNQIHSICSFWANYLNLYLPLPLPFTCSTTLRFWR